MNTHYNDDEQHGHDDGQHGHDDEQHGHDDGRPAVRRAEVGSQGWADAVRQQRAAVPDHMDFYALVGEIVPTLYALEDLSNVLIGQVGGYAAGRAVYDDTRQVDPQTRLDQATECLAGMRDALAVAYERANAFWSSIGHIGVEEVTR